MTDATHQPPAAVRASFIDDVQGGECTLVVYPQAGAPRAGVAHPRCEALADLAIDLDAFFCPLCHRNGRISGAWAAGVIEAASSP